MNHGLKNTYFKYWRSANPFHTAAIEKCVLQMCYSDIHLRARLMQLTADASLIFTSCFRLPTTLIYGSSWHPHKQNIPVH